MVWIAQTAFLVLLYVMYVLSRGCESDKIMDMMSPFIDFKELAEQAANDAAKDDVSDKVMERAYPVASVEMDVLLQMYRECRTQGSKAMHTWCTGTNGDSYLHASNNSRAFCPRDVRTHPCTGRILHAKDTSEEKDAEFLWPWEGLRCNAFTEPTTVTHIYLPRESLQCELATLDLSVMVSLEQLDLSENMLSGDFPYWLGDMTMLRLLNLNHNQLTGDILSSLAGNNALEQINLSSNNLTASTLRFFDAFHRLQHLDISNNNIDLRLPRILFASNFLRYINISHNAFRGDLAELPVFPFLESFDVSNNFLTGTIPSQLALWGREDPHDPDETSSLAIVDVSYNAFTGNLPLISNQSVLQRFNVRNNGFGGLIPTFPPSLQKLTSPNDFDGNKLLCPVPAVLLPSNLTCVCGDGYTIKSTNARHYSENANGSGDSKHVVLASEFANLCERCPDGSYSNDSTRQTCRSCPPGSALKLTSSERAASCKFCPPGNFAHKSACIPCHPGTYATSEGAKLCDLCNPGAFTAQPGSTRCTLCGVGSFASSKGMTSCTLCPAGTYVNVEGEAECLMCPNDTYQDVAGSARCNSCPAGSIAPQLGHVKCSPCSPGSYHDVITQSCTFCRPGTFAKAFAQTKCKTCENGTVAEGFGSNKCVPVAAPGLGYAGMATAVQCEPGTFNDGKWRTCQPCPLGTYAATRGSRTCALCAKGSFAVGIGSAHCELAPRGSFVQIEGAHQAERCGPNHVAATKGSTICTHCASPSFSFLSGGVECSTANPGEIYDYVEWPRLALELTRVTLHDFLDTPSGQVSPIDGLVHEWTNMLTSYLNLQCTLHVLEVNPLSRSTHATQIVVALEVASNESIETQTDQTAEKALGEYLSGPYQYRSEPGGREKTVDNIRELIRSRSFQEALVRQINRANVIKWPVSFRMVNVSLVDPPFRSTRALACARGTYFSAIQSFNEPTRICLPCPVGSYSSIRGALRCEPCPQQTFSSEKGQHSCHSCPLGTGAAPGASSCVDCSWFTYECEGFWQDLIAAVCIGAALLRMLYQKIRLLCVGDQAVQQQDESIALMTAVRTHGHTFDCVQYAPMGMISADAMFGSMSETNSRL